MKSSECCWYLHGKLYCFYWLQHCDNRWNDALCEIPTCSICEVDLPGAVASRHGHDAREAPAHDHAHATEADDDDH